MTKPERLLYIINLLRTRKRTSLARLSAQCRVSKRTIYRDLLSLQSLNVDVCCDHGYFLKEQHLFPELRLSKEEQELLGYCLNFTPLNTSNHFARILAEIESKILGVLNNGNRKKLGRYLVGAKPDGSLLSADQDDVLKCFFEALLNQQKIVVFLKPHDKKFSGLRPAGILIEDIQLFLCMTDDIGRKTVKLPLDMIRSLTVEN